MSDLTESGSPDAIRRLLVSEEVAARRRSHGYDVNFWLLYVTIANLSTTAGGSEERQDLMGNHVSLFPMLFRVLSSTHNSPMLVEACSIAIYKLCARSDKNRKQIIGLKQSADIDALIILLDFFEVDFPRTTAPGKTANRGFTESFHYAG